MSAAQAHTNDNLRIYFNSPQLQTELYGNLHFSVNGTLKIFVNMPVKIFGKYVIITCAEKKNSTINFTFIHLTIILYLYSNLVK